MRWRLLRSVVGLAGAGGVVSVLDSTWRLDCGWGRRLCKWRRGSHPVRLVAQSEVLASFYGACRVFVPLAFMVSGDLKGCCFGRREVVACQCRALNCGARVAVSRQLLQLLFRCMKVGVGFASGTTRVSFGGYRS